MAYIINKRPDETEEEYQKRKDKVKKVRRSDFLPLGLSSGSQLANRTEHEIIPCDLTNWIAEESSSWSDDYKADKAFNCTTADYDDCWVTALDEPVPQYLQVSNYDKKRFNLTKLEMKGRVDVDDSHMNDRRPDPLVILGSNDGSTWYEIHRESISSWNAGEEKTITIDTNTAFSSFRFVWEGNGGSDELGAQIGYIKVFGIDI